MLLSAVIVTRDRPMLLRTAVDSLALAAQADGAPGLEVVVVDDGGSEPLDAVLAGVDTALSVRAIKQAPGGLNAGRNTGFEAASGEVIAYLDDDVRVEPDWAVGVASAFAEDPDLAAIGGRIVADAPRPIPSWVSRQKLTYLSLLELGDTPGEFPDWAEPVGANLAIRRGWLERAGAFRAGLDREGESLRSGGDTELVHRIRGLGGRVLYWPAATVHHKVPAERLTRGWFRRRAEAQGATDVIMRYRSSPDLGDLAGEMIRPLRAPGIALKRLVAGRDLIDAELWLWSSRGRWRELRRLRRERRRR